MIACVTLKRKISRRAKPGITLAPVTWQEYRALRTYRCHPDALRYDDPDRPLPTEAEEEAWWQRSVATGRHLILSVRRPKGTICGLVHAFDFTEQGRCEIGIHVFPSTYWNQGIGSRATLLQMGYLRSQRKVRCFMAQTSVANRPAIAMYKKIGFQETRRFQEGSMHWLVLEYTLEDTFCPAL